jgi:hypothetical protein
MPMMVLEACQKQADLQIWKYKFRSNFLPLGHMTRFHELFVEEILFKSHHLKDILQKFIAMLIMIKASLETYQKQAVLQIL